MSNNETDLRLAAMQTALSTYYHKHKTELILRKCIPSCLIEHPYTIQKIYSLLYPAII